MKQHLPRYLMANNLMAKATATPLKQYWLLSVSLPSHDDYLERLGTNFLLSVLLICKFCKVLQSSASTCCVHRYALDPSELCKAPLPASSPFSLPFLPALQCSQSLPGVPQHLLDPCFFREFLPPLCTANSGEVSVSAWSARSKLIWEKIDGKSNFLFNQLIAILRKIVSLLTFPKMIMEIETALKLP